MSQGNPNTECRKRIHTNTPSRRRRKIILTTVNGGTTAPSGRTVPANRWQLSRTKLFRPCQSATRHTAATGRRGWRLRAVLDLHTGMVNSRLTQQRVDGKGTFYRSSTPMTKKVRELQVSPCPCLTRHKAGPTSPSNECCLRCTLMNPRGGVLDYSLA